MSYDHSMSVDRHYGPQTAALPLVVLLHPSTDHLALVGVGDAVLAAHRRSHAQADMKYFLHEASIKIFTMYVPSACACGWDRTRMPKQCRQDHLHQHVAGAAKYANCRYLSIANCTAKLTNYPLTLNEIDILWTLALISSPLIVIVGTLPLGLLLCSVTFHLARIEVGESILATDRVEVSKLQVTSY